MLQLRSHMPAELAQLIRGHAVGLCNNGHLQAESKDSALPPMACQVGLLVLGGPRAASVISSSSIAYVAACERAWRPR